MKSKPNKFIHLLIGVFYRIGFKKIAVFVELFVYGRDMYDVLRRSRITLNSHIDVARGSATNLRLFEATGVGTFLMTDHLTDLHLLFEPAREVGTYRSVSQCLDQLNYWFTRDAEREEIARAGQARCLRDHNYHNRAEHLVALLEKWAPA